MACPTQVAGYGLFTIHRSQSFKSFLTHSGLLRIFITHAQLPILGGSQTVARQEVDLAQTYLGQKLSGCLRIGDSMLTCVNENWSRPLLGTRILPLLALMRPVRDQPAAVAATGPHVTFPACNIPRMLKRWAALPPRVRWLACAAAAVLALAFVWALYVPAAGWLARNADRPRGRCTDGAG